MTKTVEQVLEEFTSNLESKLGLDLTESTAELQRTDDWHKQRLGLFTGSKMGDLMTCKSKAKGKDWTQKKWLLDFGDTAITYILERAIERVTGQRIETPITWEMRWGIDHEDEGKAAYEAFAKEEVQEVSFMKFLPNAGASPDGVIITEVPGCEPVKIGFELKCPATIKNHVKYMREPVAEGHDYFWQMIAEMLAIDTDRLTFATYDKRYPDAYKIGTQEVVQSETHATALIFRCLVGERLVKAAMKDIKVDFRKELLVISEEIPEDYTELLTWIENERKEITV